MQSLIFVLINTGTVSHSFIKKGDKQRYKSGLILPCSFHPDRLVNKAIARKMSELTYCVSVYITTFYSFARSLLSALYCHGYSKFGSGGKLSHGITRGGGGGGVVSLYSPGQPRFIGVKWQDSHSFCVCYLKLKL